MKVYVRWQLRTNIAKHHSQPAASLTSGAQEPAAHDQALEAAACAIAKPLPKRPRWTNPRSRGSSEPRTSWVAVIVESRRVAGQPRQHLIRYVGSIDGADIQRLSARRGFWDRADIVLAKFDQEQRERFEQTLETKVRRPTVEEVAATSPAAIRARFDAVRAARAAERSIEVQGPIKPSAVPAPATRTDLGGEKTQVKDQAEVATGTSAGPS